MDLRLRGALFRRAFWAGLILCAVPIALAVVAANPATVSGFPTQTTPTIAVTLTYATASASGTGTVFVSGQPAGVSTVPATVTYPFAINSTSASTSFQF